jgi:hypothetical protein
VYNPGVTFKAIRLTANTTSYHASWSKLNLDESLSSLYLRYRAEAEGNESEAVSVSAQDGNAKELPEKLASND